MADFLTRLVGRTLGLMPVVQPIIPSRFGATSVRASDDYHLGFEEIHNDVSQPAEERGEQESDRSELPSSPTVSHPSPMPLSPIGEGSLSLAQSLNSQTTDAQPLQQHGTALGLPSDAPQPPEERGEQESDRSELPSSPTVSHPSPMPLSPIGEGSLSLVQSLNSQTTDAQPLQQHGTALGLPSDAPQPPEERGEQESDRSELPSPPTVPHPSPMPLSPVGERSLSLEQSLNSQAVSFEDVSQGQPAIKSNTFRVEQSQYHTNTNLSSLEQPDILESDTTLASSRIIPAQVPNQRRVEVFQVLHGDVPAQQAESQRKQRRSASISPVGEQENFDVLEPVISIPNRDLASSSDRTLPQFTDTSNHQSIPKSPNPPTTPLSSTPPTPTIRVSIGRVEVRAIMPPAPPTPRANPVHPSPTLSLNDYLKQRRGGH